MSAIKPTEGQLKAMKLSTSKWIRARTELNRKSKNLIRAYNHAILPAIKAGFPKDAADFIQDEMPDGPEKVLLLREIQSLVQDKLISEGK